MKTDFERKTEGNTAGQRRRAFLRLVARYGYTAALVAWVGLPLAGFAERADAAESMAAEEAAKRRRAKYIMTLGLDASLDRHPNGPVTKMTMWLFGNMRLKEAIEKHSRGAIYVDVHAGGALGVQVSALRKVQLGIVQACDCSTQNAAELAPIWNVIDVPYSIGTSDNYWKLLFSHEFYKTVREKSAQANLMCLFTQPTLRWLEISHTVDHDIHLPDDLKGLKIRVTGSQFEQAAFKILPANPTPIAWGEVFTAMKNGAVDGVHVAPTSVLDAGLGEVVGQLVNTDWMFNCDTTWLNTRWYKSLPENLQGAIMEGAYDAQLHVYNNFHRLLKDEAGIAPDSPKVGWRKFDVKFQWLSHAQRKAWEEYLSVKRNGSVLNPLIDRFGRKDYELVVRIAHEKGGGAPRRWWKA